MLAMPIVFLSVFCRNTCVGIHVYAQIHDFLPVAILSGEVYLFLSMREAYQIMSNDSEIIVK